MRLTVLLALALAQTGCVGPCRKKPPEKKPPVESLLEVDAGERAAKSPPDFRAPVAGGLRRFLPPFGEEATSLATSPEGDLLVLLGAKSAFLWGKDLAPRPSIPLPGTLGNAGGLVVLSGKRFALLGATPENPAKGRLWIVDAETRQAGPEVTLVAPAAFGAALAGERLAVVLADPPSVMLFSSEGQKLAEASVAAGPLRLETAADRSWAALASQGSATGMPGGVSVVDPGGTIKPLTTGPGRLSPRVALPVGDAVLVAGQAEGDVPIALVVPRAGGDIRARIALGAGQVLGAARNGQKGVAIFMLDKSNARRTIVLDGETWGQRGVLADGPSLATSRAIVQGPGLLVPTCHAAVALDLEALTAVTQREVPSPVQGPCLDGLWRLGDNAAAREGPQLVTWPLR